MRTPLSIFSSKYWSSWNAEQWSLRLRVLWILICILLSGAGGLHLLADNHRAKNFLPGESRGAVPSKVEILILGDSTEAVAITADKLSLRACNLSIGGSGYSMWLPLADEWLKQPHDIRTIIVSADALSLGRDGFFERKDDTLGYDLRDMVFRGVPSFGLPVSRRSRLKHFVRFESVFSPAVLGPKFDYRFFVPKEKSGKPRYSVGVHDGLEKKRMYMKMVRKRNAADSNELALRNILMSAKSSNVSVVFVRTPVTPEFYYEGLEEDNRILDHICSIADEVLPEGNWRLFDGVGFSDEYGDFGDPNHVNGNLAGRFTKDLDAFLRTKNQRVVFKHK